MVEFRRTQSGLGVAAIADGVDAAGADRTESKIVGEDLRPRFRDGRANDAPLELLNVHCRLDEFPTAATPQESDNRAGVFIPAYLRPSP